MPWNICTSEQSSEGDERKRGRKSKQQKSESESETDEDEESDSESSQSESDDSESEVDVKNKKVTDTCWIVGIIKRKYSNVNRFVKFEYKLLYLCFLFVT